MTDYTHKGLMRCNNFNQLQNAVTTYSHTIMRRNPYIYPTKQRA